MSKNYKTFVLCCVVSHAYIILNISNNVQTQRDLYIYIIHGNDAFHQMSP